jgi:hypothetical protein
MGNEWRGHHSPILPEDLLPPFDKIHNKYYKRSKVISLPAIIKNDLETSGRTRGGAASLPHHELFLFNPSIFPFFFLSLNSRLYNILIKLLIYYKIKLPPFLTHQPHKRP